MLVLLPDGISQRSLPLLCSWGRCLPRAASPASHNTLHASSQPPLMVAIIVLDFSFFFLLLNFPSCESKSTSVTKRWKKSSEADWELWSGTYPVLSCPVLSHWPCCPGHLWIFLSSTVQSRLCDWCLGTASVLPWRVAQDEKSTIHAFSVWDLFICMSSRLLGESSPLGGHWQPKTNQIKAKFEKFSYTKSCSKTKPRFCGALSWLCVSPVSRQRQAGRKSQLLSKCPNLIYLLLPSPTQTVLLTC